jgi:hypothetical protein
MRESAEQMPHLTQTVMTVSLSFTRYKNDGGQNHTCKRREEDGDQAEEDIRRAHLSFAFEVRVVFRSRNGGAIESKVSQFVFERKVAGVKGLVNGFCLTMERLDRRHLVEWLSKSLLPK